MCWLENVWRACIVIDHCDGEYLKRHLIAELPLDLVLLDGLLELGDGIVILVGVLPPVRAG